jgi:hypothetical protein
MIRISSASSTFRTFNSQTLVFSRSISLEPRSNDMCPFWIDGHNPFGYSGFDKLNSQLSVILPLLFPGVDNPLTRVLFNPMTILHSGTSTFGTSGLRASAGGKTPEAKLRSDITLASLDDVSRAEQLPRVTRICDFHVPEMLNQLDTCHCLIVPHVLADLVCHGSLLTWSADVDLPDLTIIV